MNVLRWFIPNSQKSENKPPPFNPNYPFPSNHNSKTEENNSSDEDDDVPHENFYPTPTNTNTEQQTESKTDNDKPDMETDDSSDELLGGPFDTLEDEIKFLRSQNNLLKRRVTFHKSQNVEYKKKFMSLNMKPITFNDRIIKCDQPSNLTMQELSEKVCERLPKFLQKADQNTRADTIYIPSDIENEIGIIDIKTVDWWDMVDYSHVDTNPEMAKLLQQNDDNLQFDDTQALGGPFIVLRESDVIDAIACFVAQCVVNIPECRHVSHEEMLSMIDGTFAELREKGIFAQFKAYCNASYYYYGWGSTAYSLYSNAYVARTIVQCLFSAGWILGILI